MVSAEEAEVVTAGLTVVAAVVEDVSTEAVSVLVEVLQPLKARPARMRVNKTECFIGVIELRWD